MLNTLLKPIPIDIGVTPYDIARTLAWDRRSYTPDLYKLLKYRQQLLFVCDEFMSDRRSHSAIENFITEKVVGFTNKKYTYLISPDNQALPFEDSDGCQIKGEIVATDYRAFLILDKAKRNGVQYYRKRVAIIDPYRPYKIINNGVGSGYFTADGVELPEPLVGKKLWVGEEITHTQTAWMYFPVNDYWDWMRKRQPERFSRVPTFEPRKDKAWLSEYYKYQNPTEE